jgi:hypothetical protein
MVFLPELLHCGDASTAGKWRPAQDNLPYRQLKSDILKMMELPPKSG